MSPLDIDLTRRVREVFLQAVTLPIESRAEAVDRLCGTDHVLRASVTELLMLDCVDGLRGSDLFDAVRVAGKPVRCDVPSSPRGQLGRYRIVQPLGMGAFSAVYRAEQDQPRRTVALKVIRDAFLSGKAREQFVREAEILAKVRHPGIAEVYEYQEGRDGEPPFIAMEFVDGPSLTEYCSRNGLALRPRLELFIAVCEAVQHAHQRGIIHCDLKPANILVNEHGFPKILDFGLARAIGSDERIATLSLNLGHLAGTLAYMSPESALGEAGLSDTRSDVYSLGAILFELLSGQLPIPLKGLNLSEAIRLVQAADHRALGAVAAECKGDLEHIVAKALERDIGRRYQSPQALADDLERFLRHETVSAHPASWWYRSSRIIRRHQIGVGVAGTVVSAIAFSAVAYAISARRSVESYRLARDTIAAMQRGVAESLSDQAGSATAREALLTKLADATRVLAEQRPDDPVAVRSYAAFLGSKSDVQFERANFDEALKTREQALGLIRRAAAHRPDDAAYQGHLSVAIVKVGDIKKQVGDRLAARILYNEALAIDEELARRHPDDAGIFDQLCWSYERVGDLEFVGHRFTAALEFAKRRLSLAERVASLRPGNASDYNVWVGHAQIAGVYAELGDVNQERIHADAACEIGSRLHAAQPHNKVYLRYLVMSMHRRRPCAQVDSDPALARSLARRATELAEELLGHDPADIESLDLVVLVRSDAAKAAIEEGDLDTAAALLERSMADADRLVSACGTDERGWVKAWVLRDCALLAGLRSDWVKQKEHAEASLALLRAAAIRANATPADFQRLACALIEAEPPSLRNPAEAAEWLQRSFALADAPAPSAMRTMARALEACGRRAEAKEWLVRAGSIGR